ncbi:MAG: SRPBCC family protein [Woeseiaceae bacterium]|nr:SRPBCC family protein [Woeseiaceae bacterium]
MQKLVAGIGVFVAALIVVGLLLPRESRFTLTATVDAPPATVHALLNDWRRVALWATFAGDDATLRYSGPARGSGASVRWDSATGSGVQTIVASRPHELVDTVINPGEPGEAQVTYTLEPANRGTEVGLQFRHDYGYNVVGRYFGLLATGLLRRDYERALDGLQQLAESLPATDWGALDIEFVRIEPHAIAYVETAAAPGAAAFDAALGEAYFDVLRFIAANDLTVSGPPLAILRRFEGTVRRVDAGIPVLGLESSQPASPAAVKIGQTYGGSAVRIRHVGGYDQLPRIHREIGAFLAATGLSRAGDPWEVYVNDAAEVPERELVTDVYYPVLAP